jgi:hypothetical protein
LIQDAWSDFERRFRWRTFFTFAGDNKPYDPDYDVALPSQKDPPVLPLYIEIAIKKARHFVHSAIVNIPSDEHEKDPFHPLGPRIKQLREFFIANDYVVTNTDKNLGIAVSERTWLIEKSLECISNPLEYRKISDAETKEILDQKVVQMRALSVVADNHLWQYGSVAEFFRSNIPAPGKAHTLPGFYGIPKIHKQPVKFRPIIPCHSAVQNPAAKFVSKMLKPLILAAPTIIHGTKDLAIKLSKLSIHRNRKYFLVTGDVVAFYPNIPLDRCIQIVYDLYMEHYWSTPDHDAPSNVIQQKAFYDALITGNTKLVTQFQNSSYLQLNGLAMGVADSPDLANLFGWFFERRAGVLNHNSIAYYGRYIDDCFAIVYASSEQEALKVLTDLIKFDNCEITWNVSDHFQPFLDMTLYIDKDNSLQHMPYRKAQSHQERVPWISAHPLDVKRGTFIGEMSRLATLCSKFEHYTEAMKGLIALYVKRGYPRELCNAWLKDNIKERWNKRLNLHHRESVDVLVLKSEFNTAWNYFNAHELGETIFEYMRTWLDRADRGEFNMDYPRIPPDYTHKVEAAPTLLTEFPGRPGDDSYWEPDIRKTDILSRRMIVSRKRTRNLYDLTNLWKKIVLEKLEEHAIADVIDPAPIRHNAVPAFVDPIPINQFDQIDSSDDEDVRYIHRRSSPPAPDTWTYGRT